ALGLALRAAGAGMKVFIIQFIKKRRCSEHKALERFSDLITIKQSGTGFLKAGRRTRGEIEAAYRGLKEVEEIIQSRKYDIVILDEINVATHYDLIDVDDLLKVLDSKPPGVEVILTGRYADERVIERADLVTEMKKIKHYRDAGVKARCGIER
ncbi:MAG: cob(I)yrinic acid a,c-diamide adenosyltransferase, partial [Thermodesulfovibrionales bacterium]